MRLAGHTLASEGAPYTRLMSGKPFRINGTGTGGLGCALCSCGRMSKALSSGAQRRDWHYNHKRAVARDVERHDLTTTGPTETEERHG
jgi:hypothetical protein